MTPPGTVSSLEQQRLVDFLDDGKSLYIEGVDVGNSYSSTTLYSYLGSTHLGDGNYENVQDLIGVNGSFAAPNQFQYLYSTDADYSVDEIGENGGMLFFRSQDDIGRGIFYDGGGQYRTIYSSTIFGAMKNDGMNTKASMMERFLNWLNGDSSPHIWISETDIDFGVQYLNYPTANHLVLQNHGFDILELSSIYISGSGFSLVGSLPTQLDPGQEDILEIEFTAANTGIFIADLIIQSNDPDNSVLNIGLTGECIPPPEIDVTPLEITASVSPGEISYEDLSIYNNGLSDLNFDITFGDATPVNTNRDSSVVFFDDMEIGINGWTTETYGIDDLWHQTNVNSNSPITSWWCGVEAQGNYNTGNQINTALISPEVDLTTIDTTVTLNFYENYETEMGYDYCMVDVTIDDGLTWIPLRGDQWNAPSGSSGGWINTNLDLSDYTGNVIKIRFYFDTIDSIGNDYPGWFIDDVMVYFAGPSWLAVDPDSGTVPSMGSADLTVTLDATELIEDIYYANIVVINNDPAEPEVIIPVTLNVEYTGSGNNQVPRITKLNDNYPNPFNPETLISYSVGKPGIVKIEIFNAKGQKVNTLVNEEKEPGDYKVVWKGNDYSGKQVSSGVYYYKMKSGRFTSSKKMLLMK
jgi:hypothetical protein